MIIKDIIKGFKADVALARIALYTAEEALSKAECDITNHVYESLEQAENFLFNMFNNMAFEDCEGAGNCGCDEYKQDFIVDGKEYIATGSFEYDRLDKRFYFIDRSQYFCKEKE